MSKFKFLESKKNQNPSSATVSDPNSQLPTASKQEENTPSDSTEKHTSVDSAPDNFSHLKKIIEAETAQSKRTENEQEASAGSDSFSPSLPQTLISGETSENTTEVLPHTEQQQKEHISGCPVAHGNAATKTKKFAFLQEKAKEDASQDKALDSQPAAIGGIPGPNLHADAPQADLPIEPEEPQKPTITPGSDGEHKLQEKWGTRDRALNFYDRQVLDYLAPKMKEFIARQEFLFVATADRNGECDCTSKFGTPGFIQVLSDKYLMYPEFRGNGVYANSGNMTENPHIAMLIIDFTRDTVGIHVNGRARLVQNKNIASQID